MKNVFVWFGILPITTFFCIFNNEVRKCCTLWLGTYDNERLSISLSVSLGIGIGYMIMWIVAIYG